MNTDPSTSKKLKLQGFQAVIGLEVHVQLATQTKIFCSCSATYTSSNNGGGVVPNSNICPVCAAHPGALPVLNKKAVEYAILAGLATQCQVNKVSVFARKNYFYPDLPKGYQISQFDSPLCQNGYIDLFINGHTKRVGIVRIHLEEDAGKSIHSDSYSLVNLNRAGIPLIEIVSAPDMSSAEEAGAYLRAIYERVTCIGICNGNLQEGNFRCDVNVSVMAHGATQWGVRTEVKNLNSFRFVEKAIECEIFRQTELLKSGGIVTQETRAYDDLKNRTFAMRAKENAQDYRYFPDPDLLPLIVSAETIERIKRNLPELPEQRRIRYQSQFGLSVYDAQVITGTQSLTTFFDSTIKLFLSLELESIASFAKLVSNFLAGEISRLINETGIELEKSMLRPEHLFDTIMALRLKEISNTVAKQVLCQVWSTGESVKKLLVREGFTLVSDTQVLESYIDQVLDSNPEQVLQFRAGKEKLLAFFVGQVMKKSGGKANPVLLQDLIFKKLVL